MPVQHTNTVDGAKRRRFALFGQHHLVPAELLLLARMDACRKNRSKRLAAETNPYRGHALLHRRFDSRELPLQEGIALDLVDADRSAEHDEEVGSLCRAEVVNTGLEVVEHNAAVLQHAGERAGIFESDVTNGDGVLHDASLRGSSTGAFCAERPRSI